MGVYEVCTWRLTGVPGCECCRTKRGVGARLRSSSGDQ